MVTLEYICRLTSFLEKQLNHIVDHNNNLIVVGKHEMGKF